MATSPRKAMLLAAGLGTRMRPLTLTRPKPLIEVAGKALIDWTLDGLADAGVSEAIVNVHYLAEQMRAHLAERARPRITISDETARLLDTGGGVVQALPLLGAAPFFVCNCDAIVADRPGARSAFLRLADLWDDDADDVLMLLQPTPEAHGFDGPGDFFVEDGRLRRRGTAVSAPFAYAGLYLMHPRVLAGERAEPFSMNRVWDRAIAAGRMRAVIHDGAWYHVGTPDAVPTTTELLRRSAA